MLPSMSVMTRYSLNTHYSYENRISELHIQGRLEAKIYWITIFSRSNNGSLAATELVSGVRGLREQSSYNMIHAL